MAQGFVVGLDIPVTQAVTLLSLSFEQLGSFWEGCNVGQHKEQLLQECSLGASTLSTTWEPVRNAGSRAPSQT